MSEGTAPRPLNPRAIGARLAAWRDAFKVYGDRRQLVILLMGFSSGLPLPLTLATLSYWLAKVGVDKGSIGLFALVGIPYTFKFLWAPIFDHLAIPGLTRWLGRRRSWALLTQALLALAILAMGFTDPARAPLLTAAAALAIAFLSASQDIVIDAYRIEVLRENEQGAGAAGTQLGYRFGLLAAGAGALALSDFLSWPLVFCLLALLVGVGMIGTLIGPEPQVAAVKAAPDSVAKRLQTMIVQPLLEFLTRPAAIAILLFVLLYKFGDAIGGVMANPFYVELGFTGVEIAGITKVFGVIASLLGVAVGGAMVARYGVMRALLIGGILQAVTNLLFAVQAMLGHDLMMLTVSIGADNFTGGLGSAAFVAYLSGLCNRQFTATQYALLSSFMAAGRTILASGGGFLAEYLDWVSFFVATAFLAVPGLLLLAWLRRFAPAPFAERR